MHLLNNGKNGNGDRISVHMEKDKRYLHLNWPTAINWNNIGIGHTITLENECEGVSYSRRHNELRLGYLSEIRQKLKTSINNDLEKIANAIYDLQRHEKMKNVGIGKTRTRQEDKYYHAYIIIEGHISEVNIYHRE